MTTATTINYRELLTRENEAGIEPGTNSSVDRLLREVQGNVLKSHGRDHTTHLFVQFNDDVAAGRQFLARLADWVTCAHKQWEDSRARAEGMAAAERKKTLWEVTEAKAAVRGRSPVFVNLLLSKCGYDKLKLRKPDDEYFMAGAKKKAGDLNDPPCKSWEDGFQKEVHAVVMVAEDDPRKVDEQVRKVLDLLAKTGAGTRLFEEKGQALRIDDEGQRSLDEPPREHFGFLDGITDPLFFKKDIEKARPASGFAHNDPSAPLGLVLVEEPKDPANPEAQSCGSYVVYRKLRQHVDRFTKARNELAKQLKKQDGTHEGKYYTELANAYIMGRFRDGTPVVTQSTPGGGRVDDFDYTADTKGVRCPFQAHVRKTNPRGDTRDRRAERTHRIARRGMTYESGTDVGLLFLCAQSSIVNQFAFMQKSWANWLGFPKANTGLDPVIGQGKGEPKKPNDKDKVNHAGKVDKRVQQWPNKYGGEGKFKLQVGGNWREDPKECNWVELRGAEYFFAPSLPFLRSCPQQPMIVSPGRGHA
ncbi:Dyp-type peroxidase [Actinophytocola gossypii]|uniref:Dyp-type peroxidase n=1 Tax=Actinophytocola gossypii TaxID=2812003 RepID=A0ABT2JCZ9_9PSEU|nr:Dyp-type peroxidase domain-containing protein [Actinophytocola gossypii]MCT2585596.1 Dyp-type peroxidase [Actinophytocola gossypii]